MTEIKLRFWKERKRWKETSLFLEQKCCTCIHIVKAPWNFNFNSSISFFVATSGESIISILFPEICAIRRPTQHYRNVQSIHTGWAEATISGIAPNLIVRRTVVTKQFPAWLGRVSRSHVRGHGCSCYRLWRYHPRWTRVHVLDFAAHDCHSR